MLTINLPPEYASLAKAERIAALAEQIFIRWANVPYDVAFRHAEKFIEYRDKYIESVRNK